jgi:hypothetical protein
MRGDATHIGRRPNAPISRKQTLAMGAEEGMRSALGQIDALLAE